MHTLLRFTTENFRSIAEQKTIDFTPRSNDAATEANVATNGSIEFLRTTAIYGANSSGKSNIIQALSVMSHIVGNSVKMNNHDLLPYDPFALTPQNQQAPTLYAIEFITEGVHYQYGFSHTEESIIEEWLTRYDEDGNEDQLFNRDSEGIGVNEALFSEGKDLEERTNDNRLFLSLVGQLGGSTSNTILRFFGEGMNTVSGLDTNLYETFTKQYIHDRRKGVDDMEKFFQRIQLGFSSITTVVEEFQPESLPTDMPFELKEQISKVLHGKNQIKTFSTHNIYDEQGTAVGTKNFDFKEMESEGTKKIFALAGPIFDTINAGGILVVDELDAKMHPLISQELVSLFNDAQQNLLGAQLIFTTHDTNLLSSHLLRKDQIWFTEKDKQERTDIYSLAQMRYPDGTIPSDTDAMEHNYIQGRYGAIPYISSAN